MSTVKMKGLYLASFEFVHVGIGVNISAEHRFNPEKFANFIIQECALVLESNILPLSGSIEDWDKGYNTGLETGVADIKQHFGIADG